MSWIALLPPEDLQRAWCWRALQFTPRVALVDGCVLLDVSACERLWGGLRALLRRLLQQDLLPACQAWAQAATPPVAVALLRLKLQGRPHPARLPDDLPLSTLSAAHAAVATLERTGCRSFGSLRALPRAGVARRFGAALLEALDIAYGERPAIYPWLSLPPVFDHNLELPALATHACELMWTAQRLLLQLQVWLRAGQRGVLALELEWTHDLRRLDGQLLARQAQRVIRTAQPVQDMAHLRRLLIEHLAQTPLAAPVNHLRLRTLDTVPWAGPSLSLLPEEQVRGEPLHALVERLAARLGAEQVLVPQLLADHRPEAMLAWLPAQTASVVSSSPVQDLAADAALFPAWLLRHPLPLQMEHGQPVYQGPLRVLPRPRRVDGAGWWDLDAPKPAFRDYHWAVSEQLGLLWLYCERPRSGELNPRWFLQGVHA